jgi:hypothetical protein
MKSLSRISHVARSPGSETYRQAVREFVAKMGGPWIVIRTICEVQTSEEGDQVLFRFYGNPSSTEDRIVRTVVKDDQLAERIW